MVALAATYFDREFYLYVLIRIEFLKMLFFVV